MFVFIKIIKECKIQKHLNISTKFHIADAVVFSDGKLLRFYLDIDKKNFCLNSIGFLKPRAVQFLTSCCMKLARGSSCSCHVYDM